MKDVNSLLRSIFFTAIILTAAFLRFQSNRDWSVGAEVLQSQSSLSTPTENSRGGIPPEYKRLYSKLENELERFERKLDSEWNSSKSAVAFSAQLFTTNSNIGDDLLTPENYQLTLILLDRLQSLGVRAVTMDINFPLLASGFLEESKRQQYFDFYRNVSAEIRKRDLMIAIETQSIFPNFSPLPVESYFAGLTYDEFKNGKRKMMQEIVKELKPDYMTVSNEPDTEAVNSGQPVNTIENYISLVNFYLNGMNDQKVKYGSGFGTWQKDYRTFSTRLCKTTKLDFVNIHIYPVERDFLDRASVISDIAKQNGKSIALHEAWLHKWQIGSTASQMLIHARNSFRFWQPLDKEFLDVLVKLAHYKQFEYVSPFWSQFFFAYQDYESVRTFPPEIIFGSSIQAAKNNVKSGVFTGTGLHYKKLIN